MRIAVIQHRLRESASEDALALANAARVAAEKGAEFVVLPEVPSLHDSESAARKELYRRLDETDGVRLIPHVGTEHAGVALVTEPLAGRSELGKIGLLVGDAVLVRDEWESMLTQSPSAVVLNPRSESDLQAEASLELAIALSDSLAGLVIIAECDGAEPGDPGHGGSAIVLLGEVVAEALSGDDVLVADVLVPVPQPEPRDGLPQLPTILEQRIAHHHGVRPPVAYPADLSEGGTGTR